MTKKLNKDSLDTDRKFRKTTSSAKQFSKMDYDPNYDYRWVITDVGYMKSETEFERVDHFIDNGWDVVYSEERPEDERSVAPDNDTKNSDRLKPVTKKLKGGSMATLMKCLKTRRQENEIEKARRDKEAHDRSAKSIKKQGNEVTVVQPDVDLS